MTCKIAACDDEPAALLNISSAVREWEAASGNAVTLETFPSAEAFLFRYGGDKAFDILLADIEMGGMDGVELARIVRRENKQLQIIFITGYMEYISDGYEVEALHYLLKPVTREKLFCVLDRAVEKLEINGRSLFLNVGGESTRVALCEIKYVEVRQNYVTVHAERDYTVKKTLGEIERALDDGFFRAGRSFLIGLRHIKRITKTDVYLKDGSVIPLPRGLYEPLNRAVISYF